MSGHSPVYVTLNLTNEKKATLWRLNLNVLTGQMRKDMIKEIQAYIEENDNGDTSHGPTVGCMQSCYERENNY